MRAILVLLILVSNVAMAAPDPSEIMKRVDERDEGETLASISTLLLTKPDGQTQKRQVRTFSREQQGDRKSIMFLLHPAEVRNIATLSYRWDGAGKEDENWLYLPALDRVERVAQSNRSNGFMGSDFSIADMDGFKLHEWDYRLLEEAAAVGGQQCVLIEAKPKEQYAQRIINETSYDRLEHCVRTDIDMIVQTKHFVAGSARMKWLTVEDIREVQGIMTAHKQIMRTYRGKRLEHATVMAISDVEYNIELDDSLFTAARLRQGQ